MDRRLLAVGGVVLLVAVGLLGFLIAADTGPPVPEPAPAKPRPTTAVAAPRSVRVPVRPPPGLEPPSPRDERPPPADLTADDRKAMNYAVDGVLKGARTECLQPWLDGLPSPSKNEIVFDAVLFDGRLVDFGMRSLQHEIPAEVVSCVADQVWYADWPEWELQGELRLQRSLELVPTP